MRHPQRFPKLISNQNLFNLLKFRAKNEVKTSSHSGDILCKRSTQSDLQREFYDQNSSTGMLKCVKELNQFAVSMKNQNHSLIQF